MDFISVTLQLLEGFGVTCLLFILTLIFSLPLGLLISFCTMSKFKPIKAVFKVFVWIIRGIPLMLQLFMIYYLPGILSNSSLSFWGNIDNTFYFNYGIDNVGCFIATLIAFVINYACYFSEIFRGGIESISQGQYKAGKMLGLTKYQIFSKIVLLQVIKRIVPPTANEIITLVKDTALARVIGVIEIIKVADIMSSKGLIWPLFYTGVFYLIFVGVLTLIFNQVEKRLDYFKSWGLMAYLQVKDFKKKFNDLEVLKGISFDIEKGEVLSIIGSSGSGKSTLLNCLTFLESLDSGQIYLEDKLLFDGVRDSKLKESALSDKRSNFGLVFQNFYLIPQKNVLKNVDFAPKIKVNREAKAYKKSLKSQGVKGKKLKEMVNAYLKENLKATEEYCISVLEKMGLKDKMQSYPHQLSGGQCQRVAIARALALKPKILCLDEPTSALDPELTGEVLKVIRELKEKENITMIIVTHEMEFAKNISDKVVFMANGNIIECGSPKEVFNNPKNQLTKQFLQGYNK